MLLQIDNLITGYGRKQVINGVSLSVEEGQVVAVIGHNGAGKSTLLRAVLKAIPTWSGEVRYNGRSLADVQAHDLVRFGIAYAPQGTRVFRRLTVRENLEVAASILDKESSKQQIERALNLFPALQLRLRLSAATLSGGEAPGKCADSKAANISP